MEITNSAAAKANYVKGLTADEDEEELEEQEVQEEEASVTDKQESDKVAFSASELDNTTVENKVQGFVQNIIYASNLTDRSKAELQKYLQNFDVEKFIKSYGPFESIRDISAAVYAATSGLIKYKQDDE